MLKSLLKLLGFKKKEEKVVVRKYKSLPKGKIVAKSLEGYDAEYMYSDKRQNPGLCPVCYNVLQKIPNLEYKMQRKKGDVFYTYDGFCIVTEKFKRFCETNKYEKLKFTALPKSLGYYYFESHKIFRLNVVKGRTEFLKKRECCGQYDEILCTVPYKANDYYISSDDFICASDYWFGSYYRKCANIIVGLKTASKMKQAGITGIFFIDVIE